MRPNQRIKEWREAYEAANNQPAPRIEYHPNFQHRRYKIWNGENYTLWSDDDIELATQWIRERIDANTA
jgi:hypothetical protein